MEEIKIPEGTKFMVWNVEGNKVILEFIHKNEFQDGDILASDRCIVIYNGDIGKVIEIKTTHVRLMFKDGTSYLYNVNELEPIPITDKLIKKIGFLNISNMWYHLDELVLLRRLKHNYQIYITDCGSHYEINKIIN